MSSRPRFRKPDTSYPEQSLLASEVEIRLSSHTARRESQLYFDFKSRQYTLVPTSDFLIHLLTLPSRITLKEDLQPLQCDENSENDNGAKIQQQVQQEPREVGEALKEVYGSLLPPEELARLDSQANPFNFSDRVSQTGQVARKTLAMQTDPPPGDTFSSSVGFSVIHDAYGSDYCLLLEKERQRELQKEKEKTERKDDRQPQTTPDAAPDPVIPSPAPPAAAPPIHSGREDASFSSLALCATIVERIVNQNIFDDITQDYRYWEDTSDDYRLLEGSLLPLWHFTSRRTRCLLVADVSWSPAYPDLLAAAYTPGSENGPEVGGLLCVYTFKNPGVPERCLPSPYGLTCIQYHPRHRSVLVAGRRDGGVLVYDSRLAREARVLVSTKGQHLLPVAQVSWVSTEPGHSLAFYSVGLDGRVTHWTVLQDSLEHRDVLDFQALAQPSRGSRKTSLEGTATCIAFQPGDVSRLLVGLDSGLVLEARLALPHAHTHYPAHTAAITALAWNTHNHKVFATASLDWTLKIWLQNHTCALVTLDLGAPVTGMTWGHYSSTVIIGVGQDGRVHVYDLSVRKNRPLCLQNLLSRRSSSLSCVALNPFHPVLLVGGDRGYLVTLKLSPNLRRPDKGAKGADERMLRKIQLAKMDRIITTTEL